MARVKSISDFEVLCYAKDFIERNKKETITIRQYAEIMKVKKSTMGYIFSRYLKRIDFSLYDEYLSVAKRNKYTGHVKGGENHFKSRINKKEND